MLGKPADRARISSDTPESHQGHPSVGPRMWPVREKAVRLPSKSGIKGISRMSYEPRREMVCSVRNVCKKSQLQRKGFTQVDAFDLGVAPQRLRTASAKDPAIINNVGPVGNH